MASTTDDFEIAEYCARLSCHKLIRQPLGRGRRREYCSDTCRRGADTEYKQAKALVSHFERYLGKMRAEVAAYGRKAEADAEYLSVQRQSELIHSTQVALARSEMLLRLTPEDPDNDFRQVLQELVDSVTPLVAARRATDLSA